MKKFLQNLIFFCSKKFICMLCLFGLLSTTTMAQVTCTWTGTAWSPLLSTITATDDVILNATTAGAVINLTTSLPTCASLVVTGGPISIGSNITTTGTQTYQTAVTLTGTVVLNAGVNLITFNSTVNGNTKFFQIVNYSPVVFNGNIFNFERLQLWGNATFSGTVTVTGDKPNGFLEVWGNATINGGTITTNNRQVYIGTVTLGANTILSTTSSSVNFNGAVTGNYDLTVKTGAESTYIGTSIALADITTTGSQTYNGSVKLMNSSNLSATGATATIWATTLDINGKNATLLAGGGIHPINITNLPTAYTYWTNTAASDPGGAGTLYYPGGSNPPFSYSPGAYNFIKIEAVEDGIILDKTGTQNFTAATYDYAAQTQLTVTVSNIGADPTGELTVALSGTNAGSFTLSTPTIPSIAVGGSNTFTVVPNTGLAVGTYTATVTVSGAGLTSQTFDVSFTVNPKPVTITGITATKVYDTTNSFTNAQIDVTGATIVGKVASDVVTIVKTGVTGTFGPAVGTGTLTISTGSFALGGTDAGNYTLSAQPTVAATITKANTTTVLTTGGSTTYGQLINLTATVTATPPGAGTPTGTLHFISMFRLHFPLLSILCCPFH